MCVHIHIYIYIYRERERYTHTLCASHRAAPGAAQPRARPPGRARGEVLGRGGPSLHSCRCLTESYTPPDFRVFCYRAVYYLSICLLKEHRFNYTHFIKQIGGPAAGAGGAEARGRGERDVAEGARRLPFHSLDLSLYIFLSLSLSIYMYIYREREIYLSLYLSIYLSLSLYICIYMYMCVYIYIYVCSRSSTDNTMTNSQLTRNNSWNSSNDTSTHHSNSNIRNRNPRPNPGKLVTWCYLIHVC